MSELPDSNAAEAERWLVQADEDLRAARRIAADADLPARVACFLAHLVAEKSIKAQLIRLGVAFPKVHDLVDLRALLPGDAATHVSDQDIAILNPWSVEGRYPGDLEGATVEQAAECIASAERVLAAMQ